MASFSLNNVLSGLSGDYAHWTGIHFFYWWYGRGLKKAALFCWKKIMNGWQSLALSILFANFFTPMYGQRGFSAYALSINVHFWQLLWRLCLMLIWIAIWIAALILWIVVPVLSLWQISRLLFIG